MNFPLYLAVTAEEAAVQPPALTAWMACHFRPEQPGLWGCPEQLPPDAMLILDDFCPPSPVHSPEKIREDLEALRQKLGFSRLLLDFQQPENPAAQAVAACLDARFSCPVGTSLPYAADLKGPVFLPPVPLRVPLQDYFSPWNAREIWMDLAPMQETVTVTSAGSVSEASSEALPDDRLLTDEELHCRYRVDVEPGQVIFSLQRRAADLPALLEEAARLGAGCAIGLYQELGQL